MPPVDTTNFTPEQKIAFNRANALGSGVATIDNSAPISSTALTSNETPLNVPTFNQQTPQDLQGVIKSIPQIMDEQGESQTAQTQNDIASEILSTLRQTQDREGAQFQAETEAGIPEQQKRLQELSGRLTQLQNEALAIPLQIQEDFAGTGATRGGVEPIQTSRLRQNAIQSLTIGAQAQALQGNIALAQQQVNRAVDLEFKPIEDRLQYLQTAYTLNRDILEREDKQTADRMKVELDERNRLLTEQKAEKTGNTTL